jgi:hypothetical protein
MGKGVALEFRYRFPRMFDDYKRVCDAGMLRPGQIFPYRKERPWILNFAVKNDWRHPSKLDWVESCLQKFAESYHRLGITSVALPWIGAMNGQLPWQDVHSLIKSYLSVTDLNVELIEFDPSAPDPLYDNLIRRISNMTPTEFAHVTHIREAVSANIINAVRHGDARSLSEVISFGKLGKKSIAHLYDFLRSSYSSASTPPVLQTGLL